jgi:hypothetical protein
MLPNLYQRDFLKELDFSADELNYLIPAGRRAEGGQAPAR